MTQQRPIDTIDVVTDLCKAFHERARHVLEPLGLFKGQPNVILLLSEQDGLSQGELGAMMNLQPATVTKMVQRMASAGFVERRPDERDQRVSRVYLTEKGRQVKPLLDSGWETIADDMFDGFAAEEMVQFEALVQRVIDNLRLSLEQK